MRHWFITWKSAAQQKETSVLIALENVLADIQITSSEHVQDGRLFYVSDKAMLQNHHAHMREAEENECHQNYWPGHSSSSISSEINDPKGNVGAWTKRNCLIWALTFWRL